MLDRKLQALRFGSSVGLACFLLASVGALAQTAPDHERSSFVRYDGQGRPVGEIGPDPDGTGPLKRPASRTFYDPNGLVLRVETGTLDDWQSNAVEPRNWPGFTKLQTVRNSYDQLGQLVTTEVLGSDNQIVSITQTNYDKIGRPGCTAVRMAPAASTHPCTAGPTGSFGPDRITRNYYDAAGQLTQIRRAVGTPIEVAEVSYTYTSTGQHEYVIDANGNRAQMLYDAYDRPWRWVFPSQTRATAFNWSNPVGSTPAPNAADYEEYSYDKNGNRTHLRKRDGSVIEYRYDNLNRMASKIIPARTGLDANQVRNVVYTYDLRDLATATTFLTATGAGQTIVYNGFGEAEQITDNTTGVSRVLRYDYDANGNRTDMWYPDNQQFTYAYDLADRLTHLRHGTSTQLLKQTYDNRGLLDRVDRNSSTQQYQDYAYDPAGRLNAYSVKKGGYQYDIDWTFQRNPASQITRETRNNGAFDWDGFVAVTRNYTTNGLNQYTQVSSTLGTDNFCYDANGNLTADADEVFKYDIENRLVEKRVRTSVTTCPNPLTNGGYGGALLARMDYDPLGRLYKVTGSANNSTLFVHDGNAMVAEYNPTGTMLDRYIHGTNMDADDPLVWYEGAGVGSAERRNLYADQRGSIALVTNDSGVKVALNTFDEYGNNGSANAGRFQFTGQAWLEEAELYYYKARMYSPKLGRFLQVDPIGYEDQFNLYAYVGNDPINAVDHNGMQAQALGGCVSSPAGMIVCGATAAIATSALANIALVASWNNRRNMRVRTISDLPPLERNVGGIAIPQRAESQKRSVTRGFAREDNVQRQQPYEVRLQIQGTYLEDEKYLEIRSATPISIAQAEAGIASLYQRLEGREQREALPALAGVSSRLNSVRGTGLLPGQQVRGFSRTRPPSELRIDIENVAGNNFRF